ncbi:MAG: arginine--tRNA ligase [Phycisphaerales bacterium]|nr:arginine--tRNA ligase [Phycisphaerales bacterium]
MSKVPNSDQLSEGSLLGLLRAVFAQAIATATGTPVEPAAAAVRISADPKFGDYQCNAAMALAKTLKGNPRQVAQKIVSAASPLLETIAEPLEIAGPGFINIRLRDAFLAGRMNAIAPETPGRADAAEDRFGIAPVAAPQTVIVDYSSPNIAKQMHVGHLRSTIIGDALARVLAFDGHTVIRQNHVGDWGTQFGMLIQHYSTAPFPQGADHDAVLTAIEDDYRTANARFKQDPAYADAARLAVGRLQSGDPAAREVWRRVCEASAAAFRDIYARLGVLLTDADIRGESFYNDRLAPTVALLKETFPPRDGGVGVPARERSANVLVRDGGAGTPEGAGAADPIRARSASEDPPCASTAEVESGVPARQSASGAGVPARAPWAEVREDNGAICVFLYAADGSPMFKGAEDAPLPLIIQKSDGAFLYASTDLAGIRFRVDELHATRVLYVVGAPTKLHLEMVFATARLAGWLDGVSLEHVSFGQVLGEDGKLLRTRSGGAVKLRELLDEAEARAAAFLEKKLAAEPDEYRATFSDAEKQTIARRVGIGAVKYFDLARDRNADYVFDWDTILAMQGNTAPYMLYAYTRVRSIHRKAAERLDPGGARIPTQGGMGIPAQGGAGLPARSEESGVGVPARSEEGEADAAPIRARRASEEPPSDSSGTANSSEGGPGVPARSVAITHPAERALALRLARLHEVIDAVAQDLMPHVLCTYLYDLAGDLNRFYEACPVLDAPDAPTRASRLRLCELAGRALRLGLRLLGIEVVDRM